MNELGAAIRHHRCIRQSQRLSHQAASSFRDALVERHPNLLTEARVQWALRNRAQNGLASAVYESRSGKLVVHEPTFLRTIRSARETRRFKSRARFCNPEGELTNVNALPLGIPLAPGKIIF